MIGNMFDTHNRDWPAEQHNTILQVQVNSHQSRTGVRSILNGFLPFVTLCISKEKK